MKAILAAILSLALLLSPAASAAGRSGPVMAVDTMTVSPGQTVEVPIRLSGNTGLAGIRLTISYSQSLTLTQITKGEALSTLVIALITVVLIIVNVVPIIKEKRRTKA